MQRFQQVTTRRVRLLIHILHHRQAEMDEDDDHQWINVRNEIFHQVIMMEHVSLQPNHLLVRYMQQHHEISLIHHTLLNEIKHINSHSQMGSPPWILFKKRIWKEILSDQTWRR